VRDRVSNTSEAITYTAVTGGKGGRHGGLKIGGQGWGRQQPAWAVGFVDQAPRTRAIRKGSGLGERGIRV